MTESDFVKELINRFKIEFKKNDRSGIYGLTQRMLAYNSNKIEGSTLTEKQTASLFETGSLAQEEILIRAKDVEEMTGHFMMFNEMLKTYDQPLSHELIKSYHFKLKSGVFEDMANGYLVGEYKNRRNQVGNIQTALPEEVYDRMSTLIGDYNEKINHTLYDLTVFHSQFEMIHPFQDGNGRAGRIILFKECLKNNIIPFIVNDVNKADYYHALSEASLNKDYVPLFDFFQKEQKTFKKMSEGFIIPYNDLINKDYIEQ